MLLRRRRGRSCPAFAALAIVLCTAPPCTADDAVLYRVFLKNGPAIVSYGEYARVDDRVVFSIPMGDDLSEPRLHLVNLPADAVDWSKTDAYADAARYERYVSTRAESDFARMSADVAAALNQIAGTQRASARLDIAQRAKRTLEDWPRANYGYRADEVRQITGLLDEVILDLKASSGTASFDLSLVATPSPPPRVALLPPPSLREIIQQTIAVARAADTPTERMSLLRSAEALIENPVTGTDPSAAEWIPRTRAWVSGSIEKELDVEKSYAKLTRRALGKAAERAAAADVRGVERVLGDIRRRDARLGGKRPDVVLSLVAAVQERLDTARRLRLARDLWASKADALRAYERSSSAAIAPVRKLESLILEMKWLAGPDVASLARLEQRVSQALNILNALQPPSDLQSVHAQLTGGLQFAASAIRLRRKAIGSGNLHDAWDASSAAAACLMLLDRAVGELGRAIKAPQID